MYAAEQKVSKHGLSNQHPAWLCMQGAAGFLTTLEDVGLLQLAYRWG
jgi:hypothetical protein